MASSFVTLFAARLLMGFSEGAVIPLAQNFVEKESSPHRLGLNAGILQGVGSALFGSILAPVVLVKIAEKIGWRDAFYVAGVPGLVLGLLAWRYIKASTAESISVKQEKSINIQELWQYNNVRWGIAVACCVFGWWFATLPFISKYFVTARNEPRRNGKTMGLLGVSGLLSSIIVPALSDKIGRKPVMFVFMALGVLYPLAVYALAGSAFQLPAMFVTYFMMGCLAMVAAVIPSEAVPAHLRAKAMGLIMGVGEIVGGVLIPALAGGIFRPNQPRCIFRCFGIISYAGINFVTQLQEKPQLEK
jgi:MFS family permease